LTLLFKPHTINNSPTDPQHTNTHTPLSTKRTASVTRSN